MQYILHGTINGKHLISSSLSMNRFFGSVLRGWKMPNVGGEHDGRVHLNCLQPIATTGL